MSARNVFSLAIQVALSPALSAASASINRASIPPAIVTELKRAQIPCKIAVSGVALSNTGPPILRGTRGSSADANGSPLPPSLSPIV